MALNLVIRASNPDNSGSNRGKSSSASALVATLVPTALQALVFVLLFLILRKVYRRIYSPRTYLDSLQDQRKTPLQSPTLFGWINDFRKVDDKYILDHSSIDGYLFVRFFKLLVVISFLGCCITMPVLFPVNATGKAGQTQLDLLSYSNIDPATQVNRYYAHALVSWVFLGLVMIIIARESFYAINIRQAYRRSPWGASRISSRTMLFTSIPKNLTQAELFSMFPGVHHAWVASNCKELTKLVEDRDKTAFKLEAAEVQLSRDANTNRLKAAKGKKHYVGNETDESTRWINPKKRPTHRLKFLIGKKVDTIEYGRSHLQELLPKIQTEQEKHWRGEAKLVGAVFIEFNTQVDAQNAWQMMQHRKTKPNKKLSARQLGVVPGEVVWKNLRIGTAEHWIRWAIATAFISVMIIFWAIPVAVVGIISNVNYLTDKLPWLSWINSIPTVILGVVTGLLPVVLLAILMALVPIICRLMAKVAGYVTLSQVELQTQSWYFAFQVIQVFLITTFTSAATSVVTQIVQNPPSAIPLLATNLPKASNFYISYFILFGLSSASGTLLNIGAVVTFVILGKLLPGKTPRKIFQKWINLSAPAWGSEFPKWTNLGVIALSYSCIAPLVLGFSTIGFILLYIAFRYCFLYTYETKIDTKGEAYERAIRQLFVGVYLSEGCLIGLFAISTADYRGALGPLIIEVVLLASTILFHMILKRALKSHEARLAYQHIDFPADANGTNGLSHAENGVSDGANAIAEKGGHGANNVDTSLAPKKSKMPGFLGRIINPASHSVHALSSKLDAFYHTPQAPLPDHLQKMAYFNPAITSETPTLWIVRDEMGVSQREIRDTSKVIPITDEGATFNAKNKVEWNQESVRSAPIFEDRVYY